MADETNGAVVQDTAKLPKNLQEVEQVVFTPEEIATKGVALLQHLGGIGIQPIVNGDWAQTGNFPATHKLYILPLGKTVGYDKDGNVTEEASKVTERKRVTEAVVAAAVPSLGALMDNDKGREFLENAAFAQFAAKIRNTYVRAEDKQGVKLPFTTDEFIEKGERGIADQGLATYRNLAPKLVKALNNKGVPVNQVLLRQVLSSKAFAEALFPKVSQAVWMKVLDVGHNLATEGKLSTAIFDHWKETREAAASTVEVNDIDL